MYGVETICNKMVFYYDHKGTKYTGVKSFAFT